MLEGLNPTIINYLKLIARISPFFLVFFLVAVSFFDSQWGIKGFVYLACVLILSMVVYLVAINLKTGDGAADDTYNKDIVCRMFDHPMGTHAFHRPALNSAILAYTIVYLVFPMVVNDSYNYGIIGMLTVLFLTDTFMTLSYSCTDTFSIVLGSSIGAILSFGIVFLFIASENESLLFFNELKSNNVVCKRPSNQHFKCRVYKNGELIGGAGAGAGSGGS